MDRKIQTIEMTLANNENDIRAKQDEISQKMIHQSEMTTILGFVEEKTREMSWSNYARAILEMED